MNIEAIEYLLDSEMHENMIPHFCEYDWIKWDKCHLLNSLLYYLLLSNGKVPPRRYFYSVSCLSYFLTPSCNWMLSKVYHNTFIECWSHYIAVDVNYDTSVIKSPFFFTGKYLLGGTFVWHFCICHRFPQVVNEKFPLLPKFSNESRY